MDIKNLTNEEKQILADKMELANRVAFQSRKLVAVIMSFVFFVIALLTLDKFIVYKDESIIFVIIFIFISYKSFKSFRRMDKEGVID